VWVGVQKQKYVYKQIQTYKNVPKGYKRMSFGDINIHLLHTHVNRNNTRWSV